MTPHRLRALAALAVAAAASPALAADMQARFGNTVQLTYPNGTVARLHYEPDGAVSMTATTPGQPDQSAQGRWRLDGDRLCVTTTEGAGAGAPESCHPLSGAKPGDSWTLSVADAAGGVLPVQAELVAGR